jgi:hypothetical protein
MLSDFILPFLDDSTQFGQLHRLQSLVQRQLDLRLKPKLRLTIR